MSFERLSLLLLCLLSVPCGMAADRGEEQLLALAKPLDKGFYLTESSAVPLETNIQSKQFAELREAVGFYKAIERSGQWEFIPDGPLLRLGDTHGQVTQLKDQLYLLGDLNKEAFFLEPRELFDLELHEALLAFQHRHGAKADGILGPQTRRLLNIPPQQRINQLLININRQRQLNAIAGEHYVQVNIPEYRLRLYEQGRVLVDMKTIIGRRNRQTPVFSSTVKTLVVNPSWSVPKSIAYKDILPRWKKDKTYLARNNLLVLSGWQTPHVIVPDEQISPAKMYRGTEYQRLWEPPGVGNTLGRIKFQIDSNNSIYLHDTKKPSLFELDKRALSSGCIRLEKPRVLADALIQFSNQWNPQVLDPLFDDVATHKIRLENPIELHVTYWTAWLDENQILNFAEDLYHHDLAELAQLDSPHY